tara:strand:- start:239 stop:1003 length:765 start_codon:yes stop_codon:yes gene_type:complete
MLSVRKIGLSIGLLVFIIGASNLYDITFSLMFVGVILFLISLEKVHKEGYRLFTISMLISFGMEFVFQPISIFLYVFSLFVLWFFRDPKRTTPKDENIVISPADGTICKIDQAPMPKETNLGNESCLRVCIFMSVVNVHVNRAPISGIIENMIYIAGKFFVASLDKASEHNERNILVMQNKKNEKIVSVQIAGLVARRILSFVKKSTSLKAGERFGLIRFGSRVDVYMPLHYSTQLKEGDKVTAGESIIASSSS